MLQHSLGRLSRSCVQAMASSADAPSPGAAPAACLRHALAVAAATTENRDEVPPTSPIPSRAGGTRRRTGGKPLSRDVWRRNSSRASGTRAPSRLRFPTLKTWGYCRSVPPARIGWRPFVPFRSHGLLGPRLTGFHERLVLAALDASSAGQGSREGARSADVRRNARPPSGSQTSRDRARGYRLNNRSDKPRLAPSGRPDPRRGLC